MIEAYLYLKKHSETSEANENVPQADPDRGPLISVPNRKRNIPPNAEEPMVKVMKSLETENYQESGSVGIKIQPKPVEAQIPIQIRKPSPQKIAISPTPPQVFLVYYACS